jgi:hypothetical protein
MGADRFFQGVSEGVSEGVSGGCVVGDFIDIIIP